MGKTFEELDKEALEELREERSKQILSKDKSKTAKFKERADKILANYREFKKNRLERKHEAEQRRIAKLNTQLETERLKAKIRKERMRGRPGMRRIPGARVGARNLGARRDFITDAPSETRSNVLPFQEVESRSDVLPLFSGSPQAPSPLPFFGSNSGGEKMARRKKGRKKSRR